MLTGLGRLLLHLQAFLSSQTLIRKSSHFDLLMGGGEGEEESGKLKTKTQISNGGSVIFSSYAKNIYFTTI